MVRTSFYHGCTVEVTHGKDGSIYYPIMGENVSMCANSSILCRCHIGNNVK